VVLERIFGSHLFSQLPENPLSPLEVHFKRDVHTFPLSTTESPFSIPSTFGAVLTISSPDPVPDDPQIELDRFLWDV